MPEPFILGGVVVMNSCLMQFLFSCMNWTRGNESKFEMLTVLLGFYVLLYKFFFCGFGHLNFARFRPNS